MSTCRNNLAAAVSAIMLLAGSLTAMGAPNLVEDPPTARAPKNGDIYGVVTPPEKVAQLTAVSRRIRENDPNSADPGVKQSYKIYPCTNFDAATGKFLFKDLPGDTVYDVSIQTPDGRSIQGIDLSEVDERLARLSDERRKELGIPPDKPHIFDQDDANALVQFIRETESPKMEMEDIHRLLYIQSHGRRATVLMEKMRTVSFVNQANGQVLWRLELQYFEWNYGGWEQIANTARVIHRYRVPLAQWHTIDLEFYPQLSARINDDGTSKPISFQIPATPDPTVGRLKNSDPNSPDSPHILGIQTKSDDDETELPPPDRSKDKTKEK